MTLARTIPGRLMRWVLLLALIVSTTPAALQTALAASSAAPLAATTDTMTLSVVSAADGTIPVGDFKYIINIDNTGTTAQRSPAPGSGCSTADPGYPDSCNWVSIAGVKSSSPIYTQGNQNDFPGGVFTINNAVVHLPAGRYLISILADNYKIDGAHFTVPGSGNVKVAMQPYDLPDATIQAEVFEDTAPTNSAPDVPAERGIAGFVGHISDYIDEVTTDVYGDPLCGNSHCVSKCYVVDGGVDTGIVSPIDAAGRCPFRDELPANATTIDTHVAISADAVIEGKLIIPNVGPNRYALSIVPPDNSDWIQTTTLEGNHDWDAWVMEGATGLDTEFVVAGEPFPAVFFGYVRPMNSMGTGANRGTISGQALAVSAYIPPVGGIVGETGLLGAKAKDKNPIQTLFVSLSDLNNNDQTVYVGEFNCNAACDPVNFSIPNVPAGDYVLGVWDEPQDFIFNEQNVSIKNGEVVNLGSISMLGWWTTIEGHVFNDTNENGKMDAGEPGIPNFPIVMRTRENSIMDRGATAVTTDGNGYYWMENAYPITQWLVEEAYADGWQTTGITYQADNQPEETTVLGQGVDVNVHPVIGLGGRLDWGVKAYASGTNGGIVGTVSYDTTRNELDPAYAAIENWQPSISGLNVDLYATVICGTHAGTPCDENGFYELAPDGSYALGTLLNQYVSETWERPSGCIARNVDSNPLAHGVDENVLPLDANAPCLEAPMMGVQFGPMSDGTNFGAAVDGNYGFGDGCFDTGFDTATGACNGGVDPTSLLPNRDYLVKVEIPNDALGRSMYKVTREEDINIANGDSFVPQVPPPACAGALHTVDVADFGADGVLSYTGTGYDKDNGQNGVAVGVTVPASEPTDNPNFVDIGGSIYEGLPKPLCDMKLVRVQDRRSIAPGFNLFTDVPLPGRFWGLTVDDLNFSSDPKSQAYGEKLPLAFNPVGIYDYTNRLIYTTESDYNGLWDVLLPSTNRISCPTPSGVCANLYRFVGNDPGTPGKWNPNYNPQYRTIAAEFEAFPGLTLPADLAPTPVAVAVQIPGTQTIAPISCTLNDMTGATPATNPEFFAITKPYMYTNSNTANRTFTVSGLGFGNAAGTLTIGTTNIAASAWTDRQITFTVPTGAVSPGPWQLKITTAGGKNTVNALTFHVVQTGSGGYNPAVFEVGLGKTYDPTSAIRNTGDPANGIGPYEHALQDALDDAANVAKALVVMYPGPVDNTNPRYNGRGAYYENLVIHSPVKLQGVGPGGVYPASLGLPPVQGSIIDGIAFGGDTNLAEAWRVLVGGLTWAGNQDVSEGQVIYVLPGTQTQFSALHGSNQNNWFDASIDGLDIRGGDQQGFPGNLNAIFGGFPGPIEAVNVETQGGAIFANAYANYLGITNNIIENNGGSYGAIRIGTPNIDISDNSNHSIKIANNRILANGGTNLAGAIGLFGGSDGYEVARNDICGNFSAEYGGGISHFGLSPNGSIHDNRIYFNHSYDEGAGIMIAGELATVPTANYGQPGGPQGSGAVNVYNNLIQGNMAEDDGGGLRFLMAGNFAMNVYNNMIVNNISMHEGGGVALDDASNVRFYNNTVMNNKTTATAITSDGNPAPAGLSTARNSAQLQATLPGANSPCLVPTPPAQCYSQPLLFNDIFYNNWAGTKGTNTVTGITPGDADPWDMGVLGTSSLLFPTNSVLQPTSHPGVSASPTNRVADPAVISTLDIPLSFTSWRTNINFIGAIMVTADLPPQLLSDYHLSGTGSSAYNAGAASKAAPSYQQPPATIAAPAIDIDNQGRPALGGFDSGADEFLATTANLGITKTDGQASINAGGTATYSIVVTNGGPDTASAATVTDNFPASLTVNSWACGAVTAGSTCVVAGSGNNRTATVTLLNGGSATLTANTILASNATGSLANTATVAAAGGTADPNTGNNSATDTDTIILAFPTLGLLDNFNRATANTLGSNWSQLIVGGTASIRITDTIPGNITTGQANANLPGNAYWNVPSAGFGAKQGAAFTIANTTLNGDILILKTSGTVTLGVAQNYIRVRITGTQVIVETTVNTGVAFTSQGTFAATFANGNTLTAVANADGSVDIWRTAGATTTYIGQSAAVAAFTGTGRIGIQLPSGARVDNFSGGNVP